MSEDQDKHGIWFILDKIQKDIDRIDEKWDSHIVTTTQLSSNLTTLSQRVAELTKLLTVDNGKPSIISQLDAVKRSVDSVKTDLVTIQKHIGVKHIEKKKLSTARWQTIGKIVGLLTIAGPGIISFLNMFL